MEQRLVTRTGERTTILHEVPLELDMMELPCISTPAPKVFAPSVIWTSRGDTVYVLKGPEYRIDLYANGRPVSSFRRAVNPIRVTDELAVAGLQSSPGPYESLMRRCGVTAEQVVAAIGHEEVVSPVQRIVVDPEGRLWVARSSDVVSPEWVDIWSARGEYQGTLEAPGIPVAFLSNSVFVSLRPEETGGATASLYELRGRAGGNAEPTSENGTRHAETGLRSRLPQ